MSHHQRGVTLLEIMIASAIATVIMLGLGMIEGTRARVTEAVRQPLFVEPERKNAALAALRIAKSLEVSDRFNLVPVPAPGLYQIRTTLCASSTPGCFDIAGNYVWLQYRLNTATGELRLYTIPTPPPGACPAPVVLAKEVTALNISSLNNVVTYSVTWTSGARSQIFQGQVIPRFRPEFGPATGLQDPGLGDLSPVPTLNCS